MKQIFVLKLERGDEVSIPPLLGEYKLPLSY
jgi:hypothetical protein